MNGEKKTRTRERSNMRTDLGGGPLAQVSQQLYEIGKLPPQAVELEEAVLGALMLEKDALSQIIDLLKPEHFYKEAHHRIYKAICSLFQQANPVDILTVTQELRKTGELEIIGGAYYISQLTNRVASSANVEYHARIIMQKGIQRDLIRISSDTIREAYEETTDVFDLLDNAEQRIFAIAQDTMKKGSDTMPRLLNAALDQIELAAKSTNGLTGLPSGFTDLDRMTAGWQPSDLIIVGARPAMGKTSFLLTLARNAAVDFKHPIGIFSLEMASIQLVTRLISSECRISAQQLKTGKLEQNEWQAIHLKIAPLCDAPLFIDDTPALSLFEFRAKARRLVAQHGVKMLMVDYLQLMTNSDGFNREQEISSISRGLKAIAKELNVPVIALSQLSRAVETRGGDKRPQLSDLRESGAVEQDADMVLFLHRPEYYGMTQDAEGNSTHGLAEVIIAKQRNGPVGSVALKFIDKLAVFEDFVNPYVQDGKYDAGAGLSPNTEFNPIHRSEQNSDEEPF